MEIDPKLDTVMESFGSPTRKRKKMTPAFRRRLAERRAVWAETDRRIREMVARREQRQREWDEHLARRRARLRRRAPGVPGRLATAADLVPERSSTSPGRTSSPTRLPSRALLAKD